METDVETERCEGNLHSMHEVQMVNAGDEKPDPEEADTMSIRCGIRLPGAPEESSMDGPMTLLGVGGCVEIVA